MGHLSGIGCVLFAFIQKKTLIKGGVVTLIDPYFLKVVLVVSGFTLSCCQDFVLIC